MQIRELRMKVIGVWERFVILLNYLLSIIVCKKVFQQRGLFNKDNIQKKVQLLNGFVSVQEEMMRRLQRVIFMILFIDVLKVVFSK